MFKFVALIPVLLLTACAHHSEDYIHAAGFDIPRGQPVTAFFDDFEEPMHAHYVGNNTLKWTYYIDYENDKGEIVRYCELDDVAYEGKNLCRLDVWFHNKRVSDAASNCI